VSRSELTPLGLSYCCSNFFNFCLAGIQIAVGVFLMLFGFRLWKLNAGISGTEEKKGEQETKEKKQKKKKKIFFFDFFN
jgi:uncharacterized membrane protein